MPASYITNTAGRDGWPKSFLLEFGLSFLVSPADSQFQLSCYLCLNLGHSLVTQVDPAGQGEHGFLESKCVARVRATSPPPPPTTTLAPHGCTQHP